MIVRSWSGKVPGAHAAGFLDHLRATGVAEYQAEPGCRDVRIWRRDEDGWARFTLVSLWTDMTAIRAWAGDDCAVAVLYPGDEAFGLVPDLRVEHFELVFAEPGATP